MRLYFLATFLRLIRKRGGLIFLACITSLFLTFSLASLLLISNDYQLMLDGEEIAIIEFNQINSQVFKVSLVNLVTDDARDFILEGDQWQIDARIIQVEIMGVDSLYQLERISGRFVSIEQEKTRPKSVYSIANEGIMPQLWVWLKQCGNCWLRQEFGSATFMPMQDGARFSVSISNHGLLSTPINAQARQAVADW